MFFHFFRPIDWAFRRRRLTSHVLPNHLQVLAIGYNVGYDLYKRKHLRARTWLYLSGYKSMCQVCITETGRVNILETLTLQENIRPLLVSDWPHILHLVTCEIVYRETVWWPPVGEARDAAHVQNGCALQFQTFVLQHLVKSIKQSSQWADHY